MGGQNFEKTSFQKQIFTQGGNRPKLEQNEPNWEEINQLQELM